MKVDSLLTCSISGAGRTDGEYQIEGAERVQTLNIGGSTASAVSLVAERATEV